jgi:hypothetical protein
VRRICEGRWGADSVRGPGGTRARAMNWPSRLSLLEDTLPGWADALQAVRARESLGDSSSALLRLRYARNEHKDPARMREKPLDNATVYVVSGSGSSRGGLVIPPFSLVGETFGR